MSCPKFFGLAGSTATLVIAGFSGAAHANLSNGSFELPPVPAGSFATYSGGSTAISGWTVIGQNVAMVSTSFPSGGITFNARDGGQWLDLTGPGTNSSANGVTQNVPTIIGQAYRLSFYVGSVTDNSTLFASTVDLSIAGGPRVSFTNATTPTNSLDWQLFTVDFVATSTSTNITFFNGSSSGNNLCGLDSVTLAVIPAPSCDSIDFNNNSLFPEDQDLLDFLSVLAGGSCSTGNTCNDIDFNNDGLFPSDDDLIAYLRVLAGGAC